MFIQHAVEPARYVQRTDHWSRTQNIPVEPVGSHIFRLDGEWKNGHVLDTPRWKLPELLKVNVNRLIGERHVACHQ